MDDYEIDVSGAPVVYSNEKPKAYNPLNRPHINYKKPVIIACIFIAVCFAGSAALFACNKSYIIYYLIACCFLAFVVFAKKAAIWFVHLYQAKAPDSVRLRCVYEPSCSEYMIGAITKYGLIRGVIKGIARLFRCHPPNGGKDYP